MDLQPGDAPQHMTETSEEALDTGMEVEVDTCTNSNSPGRGPWNKTPKSKE